MQMPAVQHSDDDDEDDGHRRHNTYRFVAEQNHREAGKTTQVFIHFTRWIWAGFHKIIR